MSSPSRSTLLLAACLAAWHVGEAAVPKFEAVRATESSLLVRLVNGANVSHVDLAVHIYNLDTREEFRKTEFRLNNRNEEFSFDGLLPSTWFAFRIHYRVAFSHPEMKPLLTKQELVIRTKQENSVLPPTTVEDVVAQVEETFISVSDLYVSVTSVFKDTEKIRTIVVPELRCRVGVVKPLAQHVITHARFHFDLATLGDEVELEDCDTVCLFPFLRVAILNRTSETFRAREWCGSIQRVVELGRDVSSSSAHLSMMAFPVLLLLSKFSR